MSCVALDAKILTPDEIRWIARSLFYPMHASFPSIAETLAVAFLAGPLRIHDMVVRGTRALGHKYVWLTPLVERVFAEFPNETRPRFRCLVRFLREDDAFNQAYHTAIQRKRPLRLVRRLLPAKMAPVAALRDRQVPRITEIADLSAWLGLSLGELAWFSDRFGLEAKKFRARQRHYHYRLLDKGDGSVRLIEAAKPRLKRLQRRILTEILNRISPHEAAHGFRRGRSVKSFVAPHVGQATILKLDVRDFFPTIRLPQVQALFRAIGFPEAIADHLSALCTNSTPSDAWQGLSNSTWITRQMRWRYAEPHLPQGAATSPAIANLCAYRLDCRLSGLAQAFNLSYTRYADDMAFSGGSTFIRIWKTFAELVDDIAGEEGFHLRADKTRLMTQASRQRLGGLVVNRHTNISRKQFDELKAILTNCVRHGPASQNRTQSVDFRSHLAGKVGYIEMINASRGRRLRKLFQQIDWCS